MAAAFHARRFTGRWRSGNFQGRCRTGRAARSGVHQTSIQGFEIPSAIVLSSGVTPYERPSLAPLSTLEVGMSGNDQTARFFDTREAARYLSLGKSTLAKHRCYGTGPVYQKFGRRVLYRAEDLDAWAATKRRMSTSNIFERKITADG